MHKKITLCPFFVSLIILVNISCQKDYDKTYEDFDFVQLKYDNNIDFSLYKTYTLRDTVTFIRDTVYNGENGYLQFNINMDENTDGEYSKRIISSIKSNLDKIGLKELEENNDELPDLSIVITSMTLKQLSSYTWFPNSDYNPWWGNENWNNFYTWEVTSYYTSNNGLLSIDIFDLRNTKPMINGLQTNSVWHGTYEGIVGPTHESYTERVLLGVQDIFDNDKVLVNISSNNN